jgi:integrin beta 3
MFNPECFGEAMGELVLKAVEPLQRKISDLEKQLTERPDIARLIANEVAAQVKAIPPAKDGQDGKDADMQVIRKEIADSVKAAVSALPKPKDGADGRSITPDDVAPLIESAVADAFKSVPPPNNGKDGINGNDGTNGQDGKDGKDGEKGQDGRDGKDGLDGKDGNNGENGRDGKDGQNGADGKSFTVEDAEALLKNHLASWELDFERRAVATLEKAVDRLPKPRDGVDGQKGIDGRDGLGFDDMSAELNDRTVTLKFRRGDVVKTFDMTMPIVIDRGIYSDGNEYQQGDGVTFGGSYWIAQTTTKYKPEGGSSGWRLAVKKGRDGKDGRDGIDKNLPVKL